MVNQVCIAGLLQGLSEGLHLAKKSGLDAKKALDVISKGAAQSWQMENRGYTMVDDQFNFGFAVEWMIKDLGICLSKAEELDIALPVTKVVERYYGELAEKGRERHDTSSLITLLGDQDQ